MQYFRTTKPEQMTAQEKEQMRKELETAIKQKQPKAKVKTGNFNITVEIETCKLNKYL